MIVFSLLKILLFIESITSETSYDTISNDYTDFLEFYNIFMQHKQLHNPENQIINNVFLIPMPLLLPNTDYESNYEDENMKLQEDNYNGRKFDTVFRDTDATNTHKTENNEQLITRKTMQSSKSIPFEPSNHRNWHLIPKMCGYSSASDRITGGENASLGQYPWMARIGFVNIHNKDNTPVFRCGGSLITKNHIITAAHCVSDLPTELIVKIIRLGEFNTDTDIDCEKNRCADKVIDVPPKVITVHENYGTPNARNDIAIIEFYKSIMFTEWISPICLPFGDLMTKDFTHQKVEVAGWGFYDISINKGSSVLKTVKLPILKSQPCAKAFRGILINYKKQYCVGGDLGKDSCNGDSGGPLMKVTYIKNEIKYFLLGIISLGAKYCGLTATPAIYTKVTYYMEWILDNLK